MNLKILTLSLLIPACSSVNNLSNAKTLAKDEHQTLLGVSLVGQSDPENIGPALDVVHRYGFSDSDEGVLKASNTLTAYSANYKKALISGPSFYLATGLGIGYSQYLRREADHPIDTYEFSVPLYLEKILTEELSMLMGLRLAHTQVSQGVLPNFQTVMMTAGTRAGKKSGLHFELGYGKTAEADVPNLWQLSTGLFF